jgi:hypothetical protein
MNIFQWIACATLAAAIVYDVFPRQAALSWKFRVMRSVVWSAAMVAVLNPTQVTTLANLLGIGRGADIVLYTVTLAFFSASFFFYAQQLRLERKLSRLAGYIALHSEGRGGFDQANREKSS